MTKETNNNDEDRGRDTIMTSTPEALRVSIKEGQAWIRFLEIEVPATDVASKFENVYEDFRKKTKIPGFRPGKIPMSILKSRYASDVKGEVLERLIAEAYEKALTQENIWPLSAPKLSDIEFDENKPLKFRAEIEIRPELKLRKYKGFRVEKKVGNIGEKDVNDSIEYLRESIAEYIPVQRPAENGDLIIADLIKKYDKLNRLKEEKLENVEIMLGGQGILPEFQRGLMGVRLGEMKDIAVKYPDDYYDGNLAGDEILYMVVVKEIKMKNLPDLNDDFASRVSKSSKTLEDLRESISKNLELQAQNAATRNLRSEIIKKIVEANSFDVPISQLNKYLDSVVEDFKSRGENVDENSIRSQYRPLGENLIRWKYLYYEIARVEDIRVTRDDRVEWVRGFAKTHGLSEENAREILGKSRKAQDVDDSIIEGKVLEFVIKNSEVITID